MRAASWPAKAVVAGWSAALLWALWRFGATRAGDLYVLFLVLAPVALLATWLLPVEAAVKKRLAWLLPIGGFLLIQVVLRPTLAGVGYLHLAVGWLTLVLVLVAVSSQPIAGRWLVWVLVGVGAVEAAYGAVQALGGFDYIGTYHREVGRIATGSLINRNHFAGMLNMVWPFALAPVLWGLLQSRRHRRREEGARRWILTLGCAFMAMAVVLSQSRGGALSMVATAVFMGALLALKRRRSGVEGAALVAPWLLLAVVLGIGSLVGLEQLSARFGRLDKEISRLEVYADTTRMIADHPIAGVGPGMYKWRFRPYQRVWQGTWYQHAHNDYLEAAAEWGLPLAVVAWSFVFWRCLQAARRFVSSPDRGEQVLALGCSAAIFSIILHSIVDLNLQVTTSLMLFCSILGLSWALELVPRSAEEGA